MNNEFTTKDLSLAAFLSMQKGNLKRVDKVKGICWFVFCNNNQNQEHARQFWSGEAECSAKDFAMAIKNLKDRIYND